MGRLLVLHRLAQGRHACAQRDELLLQDINDFLLLEDDLIQLENLFFQVRISDLEIRDAGIGAHSYPRPLGGSAIAG